MSKRKSECTPEEWERQTALQKARYARWKEAHPTGERDSSRKYRAKNPGYKWPAHRENGQMVKEYKESNPCLDCGQKFPFYAMDFDHVNGTKVNNVGTMVAHGWSLQNILDEIAKCELVCSNCHRGRTWNKRNSNVNNV